MLKIRSYVINRVLPASLVLGTILLSGCSSVTTRTELEEVGTVDDSTGTVQVINNARVGSTKGVVTEVWEEPMVDDVDVPPGLDPEGHYYRPAHRAIVEIRQGRWQYYNRAEEHSAEEIREK